MDEELGLVDCFVGAGAVGEFGEDEGNEGRGVGGGAGGVFGEDGGVVGYACAAGVLVLLGWTTLGESGGSRVQRTRAAAWPWTRTPLWAAWNRAQDRIGSAGEEWWCCASCRRVETLLLLWLLEAVEAESWGCCAEPGASLSALGQEPRSLLVRGVRLNCEFLELQYWRRTVDDKQQTRFPRKEELGVIVSRGLAFTSSSSTFHTTTLLSPRAPHRNSTLT